MAEVIYGKLLRGPILTAGSVETRGAPGAPSSVLVMWITPSIVTAVRNPRFNEMVLYHGFPGAGAVPPT